MLKKVYIQTVAFVPIAFLLFSLIPLTSQALVPLQPAHAVGTNVAGSDGTVYFISLDNQRRPYTSAGAFLSYGFNSWAAVQPANPADLNLPLGSFIPAQDGKIICSNKKEDFGTCYLVSNGTRHGFTSALVFAAQGFSFSRTLSGDVSFLKQDSNIDNASQAHAPGALIKINNTVFYVGQSGILGIPDMAVFNSWGFDFADVVKANTADMLLSSSGVLPTRQPGDLSPLVHGNNTTITPANSTSLTNNQTNQNTTSAPPYVPPVYSGGGTNQIVAGNIQITSPSGGEQWPKGSTQNIHWSASASISSVNVYARPYCPAGSNCSSVALVTIASNISNSGYYAWNIPNNITGQYSINIIDAGTSGLSASSAYIDITDSSQAARDQKRLDDVNQVAGALSLYLNYQGAGYPSSLALLQPTYLGLVPTAPAPADGSCSSGQNSYNYSNSGNSYSLTFCLGSASGGYSAGPHTLTPAGIN